MDSTFTMAETRLEAMATQARNRECSSQHHQEMNNTNFFPPLMLSGPLLCHVAGPLKLLLVLKELDPAVMIIQGNKTRTKLNNQNPPPFPPHGGAGVSNKGKGKGKTSKKYQK